MKEAPEQVMTDAQRDQLLREMSDALMGIQSWNATELEWWNSEEQRLARLQHDLEHGLEMLELALQALGYTRHSHKEAQPATPLPQNKVTEDLPS